MDFLLRQAFEKIDNVLIGDGECVHRSQSPVFNNAAECFGSGNRGCAAEGEVFRLDNNVFQRIVGIPFDFEGEAERIATSDGAVLPQPIGVGNFSQMRSRLAMHRCREQFHRFLAIFPRHAKTAMLKPKTEKTPARQ
jgi:hypothetical protein